jgi:hypothetical protein
MAHDSDYFRRRAAEVRSSAFHKDDGESVEVAGHLALAYAALARCGKAASAVKDAVKGTGVVDPVAASVSDSQPMMLRD